MTRLRFLGPPRADGAPIKLRKGAALLAYLAATGHPHARDHLCALLWPESDQAAARSRLRRTLHDLQPLRVLTLEGEQVALDAGNDVAEFRRAARSGDPGRAADVYEDDFLQGFSLPDAAEFEEWATREREALRSELSGVLDRHSRALEEAGDLEGAVRAARRRLALDPLDEAHHRRLMALHGRAGNRAAALAQFEECRRRLQEDLGVEPDPETSRLAEALRTEARAPEPAAAAERRDTRYVESGGLHIAWQALGAGPPDLLVVPGFISHLECFWEDAPLARFFLELAGCSRLLLFDKRGMGLSDRVGRAPTLEDTLQDLLAVLDAAGSRRAVLLGVSEGGPAAAMAAAARPDRVAGLILYGTMARGSRSDDHPWTLRAEQYDEWYRQMVQEWGGPVTLEWFAPSRAADPTLREWWARLLRLASSPGTLKGIVEVLKRMDVRDVLPSVRVPTLVLHRSEDRAIRAGAGRDMARRIPGARYVELPGRDHWWWVGDADAVLREIRAFLEGFGEEEEPDRRLAAVAALRLARRARGDGWPRAVREAAERHRGTLVHLEADSASVMFDGPTRAAVFAREVLDRLHSSGLPAGAGLHAGECEIRGSRVDGAAPERAGALAGQAEPGQLLATSTVRDLAVGAGLRFVPAGEVFDVRPG